MADMVRVHVTADLPIRATAMPFADRVEVRLGQAFPAVLLVDQGALSGLLAAIHHGKEQLEAAQSAGGGR